MREPITNGTHRSLPNLHRNIEQIKSLGMQAGVAINPHTPVTSLIDVSQDIDIVCLISVNPGYGLKNLSPILFQDP